MTKGLRQAGMKDLPPDIEEIMRDVSSDGSGLIDYTEFLAAALDKMAYMQEDLAWSAFRVFDRNGDGVISKAELSEAMEQGLLDGLADADAYAEMMQGVDMNDDGEIDFEEFLGMMKCEQEPEQPSFATIGVTVSEMPTIKQKVTQESRRGSTLAAPMNRAGSANQKSHNR